MLRKIKNWFNNMLEQEYELPMFSTMLFIIAMLLGALAHNIALVLSSGMLVVTLLLFYLLAKINTACKILWLILAAQPNVEVTSKRENEE